MPGHECRTAPGLSRVLECVNESTELFLFI